MKKVANLRSKPIGNKKALFVKNVVIGLIIGNLIKSSGNVRNVPFGLR